MGSLKILASLLAVRSETFGKQFHFLEPQLCHLLKGDKDGGYSAGLGGCIEDVCEMQQAERG